MSLLRAGTTLGGPSSRAPSMLCRRQRAGCRSSRGEPAGRRSTGGGGQGRSRSGDYRGSMGASPFRPYVSARTKAVSIRLSVGFAALFLMLATGGCGDDDEEGAGTTATTEAPATQTAPTTVTETTSDEPAATVTVPEEEVAGGPARWRGRRGARAEPGGLDRSRPSHHPAGGEGAAVHRDQRAAPLGGRPRLQPQVRRPCGARGSGPALRLGAHRGAAARGEGRLHRAR